jgi:predicted Zn-dependent protease with MMP-like domain
MLDESFDSKVAQAIEKLPIEFKNKMENLEVLVEDFADSATLRSVGLESKWDLLGLYVGVPLTDRSVFTVGFLPERIYLFRRPILRAAGGPRHLQAQITSVVVHELGHHFGFDDSELAQITGEQE